MSTRCCHETQRDEAKVQFKKSFTGQFTGRFTKRWMVVAGMAMGIVMVGCGDDNNQPPNEPPAEQPPKDAGVDQEPVDPIHENANRLLSEGRQIFRFDTFGSERFWGDELRLHETIAGADNGGVGPGISPETALALGLKVDVDMLPDSLINALKAGEVDLTSPATTLALLKLDAVLGVKGFFDNDILTQVGFRCSACHSTVDDSFAPGMGKRLDGWPNRDLHFGEIVASAQDLSFFAERLGVDEATVRVVLNSWGTGKFDAILPLDGKALRPDGKSAATLIPPAYGLAGVNLATYTGWGGISYWNAFVGALEMHGVGRFEDQRLKDADQFPLGGDLASVTEAGDRLTSKLAALQYYQLSIPAPTPAPGSYDVAAAARGERLFAGKGNCAGCHVPPLYTEPGYNLHSPAEIGIDSFIADRSPTKMYRTTPLAGAWARTTGGYYHDGRFTSLNEVVAHYDSTFSLGLTAAEVTDLVEFLKSI